MKLKKWTALALSAALATCMLTGCPWEENEENSDDASSTPGTSQGGGHSGPDDSENTGGSTGGDTGDTGGGTEEGNPDSGEEQEPEPQPVKYTFNISVTVPDGEPEPKRYYMQVVGDDEVVELKDGKKENYTVELLPETKYTCLFWADTTKGDTPSSLTAVSYNPNTAAYAGKITGKPSDLTSTNQTVNLQPVTTKVSIQCTGIEPSIDKLTITLNFAESFNVQNMTASGEVQEKSNTATLDAATGNFSWGNPDWENTTTRLVQALGRLSRAGDNSNTCTVYTLLPSDLTDEQKTITIEHESCVYTTELNVENPVIDLGDLKSKDDSK